MSQNLFIEDDSEYSSAEDSDFAPENIQQAASGDSSNSESEPETVSNNDAKQQKSTKRKRARGTAIEESEDVGYENSGDEAIIESGLRKQRKKGKKGKQDDDDEGGEGGFVKTRRMVALATEEKKPLANTERATVDVDALWASMISTSPNAPAAHKTPELAAMDADKGPKFINLNNNESTNGNAHPTDQATDEDMIMIQRTYNFAGKVHTEEKLVPRDSAEAKLWLESQTSNKGKPQVKPLTGLNVGKPLQPPKKARRSIFEPITENLPQRPDLHFGVNAAARNATAVSEGTIQARKLNTVEKSKMDWAGFVDKEGIKDELEMAGKAKGSYLDQKDFLARVEGKKEEEARRARLKEV